MLKSNIIRTYETYVYNIHFYVIIYVLLIKQNQKICEGFKCKSRILFRFVKVTFSDIN